MPADQYAAALLALVFCALWLLSVWLRDVSIVDLAWGPAFSISPLVSVALGQSLTPRRLLLLALVAAWGLRLSVHLFWRNRGRGEDARYARMRAARGPRFVWLSLFTVFLLQAALVFVISWPLRAAFSVATPAAIGPVDGLATLVVLSGLTLEAVADLQLTRFKRDPGNRARVLDTGLWRYSRHPNYFGDAVVWWGFGLFGAAGSAGASSLGCLFGPALMTFLLLRVSGVHLLEQTITSRRPEYAAYIACTSAFVPLPRKRRAASGSSAVSTAP